MKPRERMPLKKRAALTARGYRMLGGYCPGLVRDKALCALILAVQPLFTVWFSARILDEIAGLRRAEILLGYALATLAGNFVLQLFKSAVEKVCGQKEAQMWALFGKVFSDKQMRMDYVDLENARVQAQKKQAEENLFMFGNGLAQLVWGTTGLVRGAVSLAASAAMTVSLFLQSGRVGWLNSPLWALALFLCALLAGLCQSWCTVRENRVFEKWCAGTVWYNRVFMFFGRELYMEPARAKDVRIYAQQGAADRALQALLRHDEADCRTYAQMAAYPALGRLAVGLSYALSYGFVALKALFGAFGVGSVVQYVGALQQFGAGIQEMLFVLADNAVYCRHLESLYAFLDLPNRKYQGTLPVEKRAFCQDGDMEYEIELRNVSFRYPGSETWALRGVSARLYAGDKVAIVGPNGSGKTTLIKLLCRLYDPDEGEILLNGIDIRKYDYEEYLRLFSVVFQDFRLLAFPLGENVAASQDVDAQRARECLARAGLGGRLAAMPDGLETPLYKEAGGVEVSGGEAQKIALARAVYRHAPFIVLDEPTAALDPVAEFEVYSRFDEIVGERTAVYISHRLASCRFCRAIWVFDGGRLVQQGAHEALLGEEEGLYARLWRAQAQYYRREG